MVYFFLETVRITYICFPFSFGHQDHQSQIYGPVVIIMQDPMAYLCVFLLLVFSFILTCLVLDPNLFYYYF